MSSQRWLPFVAIAVLGLTACPPPAERPAEEQFPAPEIPPEAAPEPVIQQEIAIVNTTPEPITVHAVVDGRQEELGTVEPQDSTTFTVTAHRGSRVDLEARNPAGQIVQRQTVEIVEMRRNWQVSPSQEPLPGAAPPQMPPGAPGTDRDSDDSDDS